jgi:hypothetical protein
MAKNDKNRGFIARDDFCFFALEANRFSELGDPYATNKAKGFGLSPRFIGAGVEAINKHSLPRWIRRR